MSRSYWIMQRTPDTFPSYINDIGQSMMEYVVGADARARPLPRQRLRAERQHHRAQRQQRRLLHQDRQALRLERSRDLHAVRHSRGDVHHLAGHVVPLVAGHARQAGLDAVQARRGRRDRRAGRARDAAATRWPARVTSENLARGSERMGVAQRKAAAYLADATTPDALHAAWKDARVAIRHQADVEKGVIRSSARALRRSRGGAEAPRADRSVDRQDGRRADRVGARRLRAARAAPEHAAGLRAAADAGREGRLEPDRRVRQRAARRSRAARRRAGAGGARAPAARCGGRRAAARWRRGAAGPVAAAAHERRAAASCSARSSACSRSATSCRASSSRCRWPT